MRRVISVYLPTWRTDRRHRLPGESGRAAPSRDRPFAVVSPPDGGRQLLLAVNDAAAAAALRPGMPLGHARALVPGLAVAAADPTDDARALGRLAAWCLRYSPLVAPCPPDGIWIDATGVPPLFGGEAVLLDDIVARLTRSGFAARSAIADTPGAAWAVSQHSGKGTAVVPPSTGREAIADLPLAALRLPPMTVEALRRVGFTRVGALYEVPRATITLRFGPEVGRRLDQALGFIFEPIGPVLPVEAKRRRLAFAEPIAGLDDFRRAIDRLTADLCRDLAAADVGARRLDLLFTRVDGRIAAIRIGTAWPSRDPHHLARLLAGRLGTIDPDPGVEAMTLLASQVEPLPSVQLDLPGAERRRADNLAVLVDRLANRLGPARVYGWAPVESDIPERAVRRRSPLSPQASTAWPKDLPRPVRLLAPPEPVEATALLPDHPPALFSWRGHRHRIRRADGPERIFGEWWRAPAEVGEVRDYFRVEDEAGGRFWLFRDGRLPEGACRWYLHGIFG